MKLHLPGAVLCILHVKGNGVTDWHFHRDSTGKSALRWMESLPVQGAWRANWATGAALGAWRGVGLPVLSKSTHIYRHWEMNICLKCSFWELVLNYPKTLSMCWEVNTVSSLIFLDLNVNPLNFKLRPPCWFQWCYSWFTAVEGR